MAKETVLARIEAGIVVLINQIERLEPIGAGESMEVLDLLGIYYGDILGEPEEDQTRRLETRARFAYYRHIENRFSQNLSDRKSLRQKQLSRA